MIPQAYQGDPESEARFFEAIYRHLDNALVDMWLESYMGRRPYYPIRSSITSFQTDKGDVQNYRMFSKPEQLMQALLRRRYFEQGDMEGGLDPDVYEAYEKVLQSGALDAVIDRREYENYFASPGDHDRAIERKFSAYKSVFLPEYIRLMENELAERKKQREEEKKKEREEDLDGEPEEQPQKADSDAVPLTKEEEQELIEQILKQLIAAGKEFSPLTLDEGEEAKRRGKLTEIKGFLEARHRALKEGKQPEKFVLGKGELRGEEAIRRLAEQLRLESLERGRSELANQFQVREESIQDWERIKEQYHTEIESLAGTFAQIFLDNRRKRLEYLRREGEIVPGLEHETIAALISGELDPDTKMEVVQDPEFLETELEILVDTSSSMAGSKIKKSVELLVILTEALKKTREDLVGEDLLVSDEEQPLRIGVTKFANAPERVTKLEEPITDQKELTIIDRVSQVGGGTNEVEAFLGTYRSLTLEKNNIIKILLILTDGEGQEEKVHPIVRQVEDDDEVALLVVGYGDDAEAAQAIIRTYLEPLKKRDENVHGMAVTDPGAALPEIIEFIKRQVEKRRT